MANGFQTSRPARSGTSLAKRSEDGTAELVNPEVTIDVVESSRHGVAFTVTATASDALTLPTSAIERVEFYIAPEGSNYSSIKIDRTSPYSVEINPINYATGSYYIKAIAYDIYWNYTQYNVGPVYFGVQNFAIGGAGSHTFTIGVGSQTFTVTP